MKRFAALLIAIAMALVAFPARSPAQATPPPIPAPVVQTLQATAAVTPAISQGLAGIQQAQQTGDTAAVIQATGNAISQVAGAAASAPTPASPYLLLAAILTPAIASIIASIVGLFTHGQANATAQAAIAATKSTT